MAPDRAWKKAERYAAGLLAQIAKEFGVPAGAGRRFWANSGEDVDVENEGVLAQVKNVKRLSLTELEKLAMEAERQGNQRLKAGIVLVKRRAGKGVETPWLVVMTAPTYREQNGALPGGALMNPYETVVKSKADWEALQAEVARLTAQRTEAQIDAGMAMQARDELRVDVARLTLELQQRERLAAQSIQGLVQERDAIQAEVARLRAAVVKYGGHLQTVCIGTPCRCGFDAALARAVGGP